LRRGSKFISAIDKIGRTQVKDRRQVGFVRDYRPVTQGDRTRGPRGDSDEKATTDRGKEIWVGGNVGTYEKKEGVEVAGEGRAVRTITQQTS